MNKELKTEIRNLQEAITKLAKYRDHKSKIKLFEIFVRLRLLYGYNLYADLDNGNGYALSNKKEHYWIFIAEKNSRILSNRDYNGDTSNFKQFCCLGDRKCILPNGGCPAPPVAAGWSQGVNASTRISLSWSDYSLLSGFFKEFKTFDESSLITKILRIEKLRKLFNQKNTNQYQ